MMKSKIILATLLMCCLVPDITFAQNKKSGRAIGTYTYDDIEWRYKRIKTKDTPEYVEVDRIPFRERYGGIEITGEIVIYEFDPTAKERAGAAAWSSRQRAKARTILNQAEQKVGLIKNKSFPAEKLECALEMLKVAVDEDRMDKVLFDHLLEDLRKRFKNNSIDMLKAAYAVKWIAENIK